MHNARKSRQLDEALKMTFPASDPTAVGDPTSTEPPRRPVDRRAPQISKEQVDAAAARKGKVHRPAKQGGKPDPNATPTCTQGQRKEPFPRRNATWPWWRRLQQRLRRQPGEGDGEVWA